MRRIIFFAFFLLPSDLSHASTAWGDAYRTRIEKVRSEPTRENMMALADEIATHHRYAVYRTPEELAINNEARMALCQIPGHARYFAEDIDLERAKLKPGDYRYPFDSLRHRYLTEILPHLPSPETVNVLGAYLADERDIPWEEHPSGMELIKAGKVKSGGPGIPDNARLAAESLSRIGLRDIPSLQDVRYDKRRLLAIVRPWFASVKSGEQAFSFKGQSVEYRFKPDGTWVSTPIANPPDDAPAPPPAKIRQSTPAQASSAPPAATPVPAPRPVWPWIAGGIVAVLAATGYFLNSRRSSDG